MTHPTHGDLRRIAERATPGPWTREKPKSDGDGFACGVGIAATAGRQMIYANPPGGSYPSNDADFIAAFNPAVALSLLDSLAAKDAEIAELRNRNENMESHIDENYFTIEKLRERLTKKGIEDV